MIRNKPYSEKELKVIREIPTYRQPDLPPVPVYDFPVSPKEGYIRTIKKDPVWQITGIEITRFHPAVYPDNVARGIVNGATSLSAEDWGGKDMFGIEWKYDEKNRGASVVPGLPLFTNANAWEENVLWPEVNSWDWKGSAKENSGFGGGDTAVFPVILNGYFERLVTFMDFENAAIALIDEDQKDAVKTLFEKLTDLYIQVVDKFIGNYNVDGFIVHDDWGSQNSLLFSTSTAEEMIVPAMKRLTDHIHKHSKITELHSCGLLDMQVPNMVAAGWDAWLPQSINDTHKLYDKYGDKIILGVIPDEYSEVASEEQQCVEAAKFVEKFCNPNKPALLSIYGSATLTPVYREELYKLSRQKYLDI